MSNDVAPTRPVRIRTAAVLLVLFPAFAAAGAAEIPPTTIEAPLGEEGPQLGRFSDRTLVVGVEVDRDSARVVAHTAKPRPYFRDLAPVEARPHDEHAGVQVEVVLRGPSGQNHTRRIDAGPLCFLHGGDSAPHVAGDTIRVHRDSFVVELPELAGFDRVEVAYYERNRGALTRRVLVEDTLDRAIFDPAAGPIAYDDLAFALPLAPPTPPAPPAPLAADVLWPEDFADPDSYLVFGDEGEGDRRINVVIVPDGYRYADKALMETHATQMVDHFRGKKPYSEHDPFINYILVYAYSVDAGADECDCGTVNNTAMGTRFPLQNPTCGHSDNRCLYYGGGCDTNGTGNIVAAELRAPFHDESIVMVNTGRYGGCGGARAVYSAANGSAKEIAVHELGHSLGGLADEYSYNSSCGVSAGEVNTSKNAVSGAWPEWIAELGPPVEGAQYYQQCVYRPVSQCEMRSLNQPFCAVCNQHWSLVTFGHPRVAPTAPIESQSPEPSVSTWTGVPVDFSVATRLSSGAAVTNAFTWRLQGPGLTLPFVVATGTPDYTHEFSAEGVYILSVEVIADTNFVKPEKYGANADEVSWQIEVALLLPPEEVSGPGSPAPFAFDGRDVLTWEDASGQGAFTYNLYRGTLGQFAQAAYGECAQSGLAVNSAIDSEVPPTGTGWFYLVAGDNPVGEGPLGDASNGDPRASSAPCE